MNNLNQLLPKVFLCHASPDKPIVRRIAADLIKDGIDVWLDEWEIHAGDSISAKIRGGLGAANYVIVAISESLLNSKGALRELDASLIRATYADDVALVPIRLDNTKMPPDMTDLFYADFLNSYDYGIAKVKQVILEAATITDTNIVVSLEGNKTHGFDQASLIAQLRSTEKAYKQKKRDLLVRLQPGELFKQLEARVLERLKTLDSEPEEWKVPEHDLAGNLSRMLEDVREELVKLQQGLQELLQGMLDCGKFNVFDISVAFQYSGITVLQRLLGYLAICQRPDTPEIELVGSTYARSFYDPDATIKMVYGLARDDMIKLTAGNLIGEHAPILGPQFSFWSKRPVIDDIQEWRFPFSGEWFSTSYWCKYALPQLVAKHTGELDITQFVDKDTLHLQWLG